MQLWLSVLRAVKREDLPTGTASCCHLYMPTCCFSRSPSDMTSLLRGELPGLAWELEGQKARHQGGSPWYEANLDAVWARPLSLRLY